MEPGAGEFALLAIAEPNHKNPWNSDSAQSKPPGGVLKQNITQNNNITYLLPHKGQSWVAEQSERHAGRQFSTECLHLLSFYLIEERKANRVPDRAF